MRFENLMVISFQKGQILSDFISVRGITCMLGYSELIVFYICNGLNHLSKQNYNIILSLGNDNPNYIQCTLKQ